jgi:formylglycine-generating enzyme required for sulfatase activity
MASDTGGASGGHELFVVCAAADRSWTHGFLLPALGLDRERVLTSDDFPPGSVAVEQIEHAIASSRYTVLVLSPSFAASPWSVFSELLTSHHSARSGRDRLVPIVLERYELPLHLDFRVWLDCTTPERWEPEAARLRALLQQPEPESQSVPCPYPGLMAFGNEEAGLFFGRDREADEICRRIERQGFLLIMGPSGCGKSSLVSAGLVPRLIASQNTRWLVRPFHPDTAPLHRLSEALAGDVSAASEERIAELVDALLGTPRGCDRLLVLLDQAEAIFVLASQEEQRQFLRVVDILRRLARCVVVMVVRADFFGHLMTSALWPVSPGERVEIAPLRGDDLREAVSRPAARVGVYVEPVLVERLMHDAAEEPAALPLLQVTLVLLWEQLARRLLTVAAYERLGGVGRTGLATALATMADAAVAALSPAGRDVARRIFTRLVQLGEGQQDIRREQPVAALRSMGDDPELFDATLRHLVDARLLTLSRADGGVPVVTLGHEAMIQEWWTLRMWLDDSRERELLRRRIDRDATYWVEHGSDPGDLYRRRRLAEAREWAAEHSDDLSQDAVAFLGAARRHRAARRFGAGTAAAAALAGLLWLAIPSVQEAWFRHEARRLGPTVHLAGGQITVGPPKNRMPVSVPPLEFAIHEVTNREYRYCVQAGPCSQPHEPVHDSPFADGDRNLPVVYVNAYQAAQYCSWLGYRLPTEAQWEHAARGNDQWRYPWGDSPPSPGQVNALGYGPTPPRRVAAHSPDYARGRNPEGVEHLVGNVAEFTATLLAFGAGDEPERIGVWNGRDRFDLIALKGGDAENTLNELDVATAADAEETGPYFGFRCVVPGDGGEG